MATPNMNLTLPTVSSTLGPAWATQLNAAITSIDSHDHTTSKGVKIPTAGLNINADLTINQTYSIYDAKSVRLYSQGATLTGVGYANGLHSVSGDLYFTNASGTAVRITNGSSIVSSVFSVPAYETYAVSTSLTIDPVLTFNVMLLNTSAARAINLPLANSVAAGRFYYIKDISGLAETNNVTVSRQGSDTIDGATSVTINSNYFGRLYVSDGSSKWYEL